VAVALGERVELPVVVAVVDPTLTELQIRVVAAVVGPIQSDPSQAMVAQGL
jgi:predicted deacylase